MLLPSLACQAQCSYCSNERCGRCALRYLCGGACRAWATDGDPSTGPGGCTALHAAERDRLLAALNTLQIGHTRWQMAGLPIPLSPP
jgi:hypothetical protein